MSGPTLTHLARSYGAMIAAWFGAVWLIVWCSEIHAPAITAMAIVAVAVLISVAAFVQAGRLRRMGMEAAENSRANRMRLYAAINGAQWLLIFGAAAALAATRHPQWIVVAVILIVGLHFIPLGRLFADPLHYATGTSLVLLACVYPFLSRSGPAAPIGLLGAGIILWLGALAAVVANHVFQRVRRVRH